MSDSGESAAEETTPGLDMPLRSAATTAEPRTQGVSHRSTESAQTTSTGGGSMSALTRSGG